MTRDHHRAELDLRHKLTAAQTHIARLEQALAESQATELAVWLRGQLHDPGDFFLLIGRENVVDDSGRVDYVEAKIRLDALRARKPHLFIVRVEAPDVGRSS